MTYKKVTIILELPPKMIWGYPHFRKPPCHIIASVWNTTVAETSKHLRKMNSCSDGNNVFFWILGVGFVGFPHLDGHVQPQT